MGDNSFNYENTEIKLQSGGKIVRKVSIKRGKGYKSVTRFRKGKRISSIKKPIHKSHIQLIKNGKFIPGLFLDCKCREKKTRKNKKGGVNYDIETGKPETFEPIRYIPPDPKRFEKYQEQLNQSSFRSTSPQEAYSVFEGPTPEGKAELERKNMLNEDPLYSNPLNEQMESWGNQGGKRKNKNRSK